MVVGLAAAATIGTFAACGSDSGTGVGTGGAVDLTGTYTLVSLVLGGILPAPGSSGTLTATADSVHADITIVSPNTAIVPDTTLSLVGSYVAKQTSHGDSVYIVINGLGTIPGGFAISGAAKDTLSLNLVTTAGAFGTTWHKQ
jgi:hypothetical protein